MTRNKILLWSFIGGIMIPIIYFVLFILFGHNLTHPDWASLPLNWVGKVYYHYFPKTDDFVFDSRPERILVGLASLFSNFIVYSILTFAVLSIFRKLKILREPEK
jgi:hypothetical protein